MMQTDVRNGGAPSPAEWLRTALWFGLLTGIGEVIFLGVQRYAMGRFIFLSRDVVWMAPVTDAVFALVLVLLFLAGAKALHRRLSFNVGIAVLAALGFTALLFMYPRIQRLPELILAIGLGITTARILGRFAARFRRLVRATTLPLVGLVVLGGLGLHGWLALRERRAIGRIPDAPPGAPNVLLIILDTVRSMDLSLYGYERRTSPQLERWAASGVTFDHAYSAAPWTLPSHASMFTGRWPHEFTADWGTPLDGRWPTLAEQLAQRGYLTMGVGANYLFCTWESGLTRGFSRFVDAPISAQQALRTSSIVRLIVRREWFKRLTGYRQSLARMSAADVNRQFLSYLDQAPQRPFFAFLNYFDAHSPYLPPAPYDTLFPSAPHLENLEVDEIAQWTPAQVQSAQGYYDRSLAYLDDQVGRLLDSLAHRRVLENTLVIIVADHGEEFFEHQVMGHGNSLYRTSVQIPLVVLYPGHVPAGTRVELPVSNRQIPATIMDLLGFSAGSPFPAKSLAGLWRQPGDSTAADTVLSLVSYAKGLPRRYPVSRGDMSSITAPGYRLIHNGDGVEELYNAVNDPWEALELVVDSTTVLRDGLQNALKRALGAAWNHRKPTRGRQH